MSEEKRRQFPGIKGAGSVSGFFIADTLAVPVQWNYHRFAFQNNSGRVWDYMTPRNPYQGLTLSKI